jgi:hypothetical protein
MEQMTSRSSAIIALIAASIISGAAQGSPPRHRKQIVVHAASLLDVRTGRTRNDQVIVIEGDKSLLLHACRVPGEFSKLPIHSD